MTPEWQHLRDHFTWDGSWRDVYVLDTTASDWQVAYSFFRCCGTNVNYTVDGEPVELPQEVATAFATQAIANTNLRFCYRSICYSCHFFTEHQLELDFDPSELSAQADLDALCEFLRALSNALGQSVIVTPENSVQEPFLRYDPGHGAFSL